MKKKETKKDKPQVADRHLLLSPEDKDLLLKQYILMVQD